MPWRPSIISWNVDEQQTEMFLKIQEDNFLFWKKSGIVEAVNKVVSYEIIS